MPRENYSDGQSLYALYARLALLIVGWATAGVILFALSTVLPIEVLAMIAIAAWVIVRFDTVSRKNKSLASLLCIITCLLTGVCAVALRITHWHDYLLERLIFVGLCLGAGIFCRSNLKPIVERAAHPSFDRRCSLVRRRSANAFSPSTACTRPVFRSS